MKIEAVTVCVNFSDFLSETLPLNKQHFDRMVVVTSPEDEKTQKLCEYHHVECVTTSFGPDGEFHKGVGINEGLNKLNLDGWVVHIDADVVLPPQTKQILQSLVLDRQAVYGVDRMSISGYRKWRQHTRKPKLINESGTYIHTEVYPVATRFMSGSHGGWLPIGFFQMWNPVGSGIRTYPASHTSAGRTDMLFSGKWPRAKRGLLPEIVALHLESESAPQGTNWSGRKTRPFRRVTLCELIRFWFWRWWNCEHDHHHHHHHPNPPPYGE